MHLHCLFLHKIPHPYCVDEVDKLLLIKVVQAIINVRMMHVIPQFWAAKTAKIMVLIQIESVLPSIIVTQMA